MRILLALLCSLFLISNANAFEVGETVGTAYVCAEVDAPMNLALTEQTKGKEAAGELAQAFAEDGQCLLLPAPIPLTLVKLVKSFANTDVWEATYKDAYTFYIIGLKSPSY